MIDEVMYMSINVISKNMRVMHVIKDCDNNYGYVTENRVIINCDLCIVKRTTLELTHIYLNGLRTHFLTCLLYSAQSTEAVS